MADVPDFDALLTGALVARNRVQGLVDEVLEELDPTNREKVLRALHLPVKTAGNAAVASALKQLTGKPFNAQHVGRWRKANCG